LSTKVLGTQAEPAAFSAFLRPPLQMGREFMEMKKASSFDRVLSSWDIMMIAFGAMIGWGWVVSSGDWIEKGGIIGGALGFAVGGAMVFLVGLTYAELTGMMPQCGGEHVFSHRALGPLGSFACTWAIVLGYASVACFEACALPTIITYLWPDFLQGYLYTVAGFDVYSSWLAVGSTLALFIAYVNIRGVKTAAFLQTVLTVIIGGIGLLLVAASAFTGSEANFAGQFFAADGGDMLHSVMAVALVTPFFFIGFDVIPQAAEEINVPLRKIGRILILSVVLAVAFYAAVILAVGYVMPPEAIAASMGGSGLVTADAMARAFGSSSMAKVLIIGGMCGIVTSWNAFLMGGSRAMYSMAESYMIPRCFAKLHPRYKTPVNALLLIGALTFIAPLFGRKMLVWVVDAGNFGCCLAYCMVAVSFLVLRKREPEALRPYRVTHYRLVGLLACLMSAFMVGMYIVPGSVAALAWQEWIMVAGWIVLGVVFGVACKLRYGEKFGTLVEIIPEEDAAALSVSKEELSLTVEQAVDRAIRETMDAAAARQSAPPLDFSYFLPVNIVFGCGKTDEIGRYAAAYGRKALLVTGHSSPRKAVLHRRVAESLAREGIESVLFDRVTPNPLTTTAEEGALLARAEGCDMVVAVGGGSIMDCAKAIAFLAINDGDINAYIFGESTGDKALPLILFPTTCGTGSEGNGFAVLTNPETGDKKSLRTAAIIAKVSVIDPECMMTMPAKVLASVGFDALCHSIEAYTSKRAQPLTDALSLYAIDLLAENLPGLYRQVKTAEDAGTAYEGAKDRQAWERIAMASTIGGMVINTAGVTLGHGMEHPASGKRNLVHGEGLAALEPVVVAASIKGARGKFGRISRLLGGFSADDCAEALTRFLEKLDMRCSLGDLGVQQKDIAWMAGNCMKVSAGNIANNPVQFSQDEVEELYRLAM